ncbi:MAG: elongation factor P [Candidatus Curtissbacteria bacterium]|nr:elongation factor P [Candidatus Curtissbacteria bacterium]
MISVTELRSGIVFEERGEYLLVLSYEHIKMGRGSGNIKVKVRNLKTGSTVEKSFITGAKVQDINLQRKKVQFLYQDGVGYYFMDLETYDQFILGDAMVGYFGKFLKEGLEVLLFAISDEPVYIELPKILDYKVAQTGGSARGNSAGAAQKDAVLENGLVVKVPLFIKGGEIIRVDTRDASYVERAK